MGKCLLTSASCLLSDVSSGSWTHQAGTLNPEGGGVNFISYAGLLDWGGCYGVYDTKD